MPLEATDTVTIAHAIQLAVAPVFLLTGVAGILGVLTNRLGRIIDRSRALQSRLPHVVEVEYERVREELITLGQRAQLINWSIRLCTLCALLVCSVIAALFLSSFIAFNLRLPVAVMFVLAMLSLIVALLNFLREIYLATVRIRLGS